jgi:8-hydroxy-5-deazaflavin:NADPH oxidoreductase
MRIALIGGTGREGSGLAVRWARAGHQVCLGSREATRAIARARELEMGHGVALAGAHNAEAACCAEVVVLSVPYAAHQVTLETLAPSLRGRIVIDVTVPILPGKPGEVQLPRDGAVALGTQRMLGTATPVVAALHHVSAVHLAGAQVIDSDVLMCSDHAAALDVTGGLIRDLGLRPLDCGPLVNALALEALTPLLLHLNRRHRARAGIRITGLESTDRRPGSHG